MAARDVYGVAIVDLGDGARVQLPGDLVVDEAETAALRSGALAQTLDRARSTNT